MLLLDPLEEYSTARRFRQERQEKEQELALNNGCHSARPTANDGPESADDDAAIADAAIANDDATTVDDATTWLAVDDDATWSTANDDATRSATDADATDAARPIPKHYAVSILMKFQSFCY